jgi:F0F1-type ATP synthase gamma subunit
MNSDDKKIVKDYLENHEKSYYKNTYVYLVLINGKIDSYSDEEDYSKMKEYINLLADNFENELISQFGKNKVEISRTSKDDEITISYTELGTLYNSYEKTYNLKLLRVNKLYFG